MTKRHDSMPWRNSMLRDVSEQYASDSLASLRNAMIRCHGIIAPFESSAPKGLASDQKDLCHHTSDVE